MIQTLYAPDSAVSTLRAPVSEQVLPLRVRDVMSVSPVTIPPSMSVHEAHTLMQQRKVRHLPVLQDREMPDLTLLHEGMGLMHRHAWRNRHRGHRHHIAHP